MTLEVPMENSLALWSIATQQSIGIEQDFFKCTCKTNFETKNVCVKKKKNVVCSSKCLT